LNRCEKKKQKALSIDPINAHILELLNMALESSTVPVPSTGKVLAVSSEAKKGLLWMRAKYGKDKVKDEQLEEACGEQGHEMHVG
jgi:hypothetical protein